MKLPVIGTSRAPSSSDIAALTQLISGDVRFGRHERMLYSTDASMYQVEPLGVVVPQTVQDVVATIKWCDIHDLPVLARGGGTSLSGQTVNRAVVIDCSQFLTGMGSVRPAEQSVDVEPGVVLEALQQHAAEQGLLFGPEVSTSTHATLGGMIANRSAGLHSLRWGMTDAHVLGLDVVLADGSEFHFGPGAGLHDDRVAALARAVVAVVEPLADEIDARYPVVLRNVGGYALDQVLAELRSGIDPAAIDLSKLIAGSEGTLGFIVGANLNLEPIPIGTAMAVLAFENVRAALESVPTILQSGPASVELLDSTVLAAARRHETYSKLVDLLPSIDSNDPGAVLYVDWFADSEQAAASMCKAMQIGLRDVPTLVCQDLPTRQDLWRLRKVGLGLILSGHAGGQPVGGLEDCAVPIEHLSRFQAEFESMLASHGLDATYYAHVSVGLIHIRPRMDLRTEADRAKLLEIAAEATNLVRSHGGTVSGEHGDGRIRAAMMHEFYGEKLVEAFRAIKRIFDPKERFNPGMITSDPGMVDDLRIRPGGEPVASPEFDTWFKWDDSFAAATAECNGNAYCRRTSGGAMCPSYRATRDERHATRGRANALRLAITGQLGDTNKPAWDDPEVLETLDLCIGCKACRSECPAEVDVAKMKAEYLAQSYRAGRGPSLRTRLKGDVRTLNRIGSLLHPVSTRLIQHGPLAWGMKRVMGVASSRTLPGFGRSLRRWHERRDPTSQDRPTVLLYPDCFTTWSEPDIGRDAIRLLEAFGYRVVMPRTGCCARTLISAGLLDKASVVIGQSAAALHAAIVEHDAVAVVAVEPSCATTLQQEWQELRTSASEDVVKRIAELSDTVEGFIASNMGSHPATPTFKSCTMPLPIHQHCHQKHRATLTEVFLRCCGWPQAEVIDTGCCGMAGAFGYEARHEQLSREIGEQSLDALRDHVGPVAACGTSCRHQLADVMRLTGVHPVSLAASALLG